MNNYGNEKESGLKGSRDSEQKWSPAKPLKSRLKAAERGKEHSPASFQPRVGPVISRSKRRPRRRLRPSVPGPQAAAMALG